MLRELSKIVDDNEHRGITEKDLQNAAAFLRRKQFVWREERGHKKNYDLITTFPDYFTDLFDAFGDEVFFDKHFDYCGLIPRSGSPLLAKRDTIFLLILGKLHDGEALKAATDNGRSQPSEALLLDEYEKLTGQEKPKSVETRESLKRLERAGIIKLGEINQDSNMNLITILPSIMRVLNSDFLNQLASFSVEEDADE